MSNSVRPTSYNNRAHHTDGKGIGYGKGPDCPKLDCCEQLLSQLGVPDPERANFYETLVQLIQNQIDDSGTPLPPSELAPYPFRTMYVSAAWVNAENLNSNQFSSIQDAVNAAADLAPTSTNRAAVVVYPGTYAGAVALAPNVDIYGSGGVVITGAVTYDSIAAAEARTVLQDLELQGSLSIDTASSGEPTATSTIIIRNVDMMNIPLSVNLSAPNGDTVIIDGGVLQLTTLTANATSSIDNGNYAQLYIGNAQVTIASSSTVSGSPSVVVANRANKVIPARRAIRRGPRSKLKQIVIPGTPINSLFFQVDDVSQFQLTGVLTLNSVNALLKDTFFSAGAADAGTANILTSGTTVLNTESITLYNPGGVIAILITIGSGLTAALMNSNYDHGALTGVDDTAAANRTTEAGTLAVAIGNPAVAVDFTTASGSIPYITPPTVVASTDAAVGVNITTITPSVAAPYTTATIAFNVVAAAPGTVSWAAIQQTTPLAYV